MLLKEWETRMEVAEEANLCYLPKDRSLAVKVLHEVQMAAHALHICEKATGVAKCPT